MADTKISALPSGAPAQAGDEYVIARGGANYKLTGTNLLGLVTGTANTFTATQTFGTADITTLEASNLRALDGTPAATVANSTGVISVSTKIEYADGTAAAPTVTNTGDTDTGMYFPAANEVAVAAGGSVAAAFNTNGLFFRNRIINGDMRIDQRNAGASVTINTAAANYVLDRFFGYGQASDGVYTLQRSTTAPSGFTNSLIATATTADSSLGATQFYAIAQYIEGFNAADFGWGASGALTVTLSFWVRSSVTGTFGGVIRNSAANRSYPFTYSISVANAWEYKTITIPGDTSGTWATDNTSGPQIWFSLGTGSTLSGTAGAWAGANYISATGATNLMATLSATFYITGVQLETGSVATPFERRPYGTELMLCQRYYYKITPGSAFAPFGNGLSSTTTTGRGLTDFAVTMRAAPTALSTTGTAADYGVFETGGNANMSAVPAFLNASVKTASYTQTVASGLTDGRANYTIANNATAFLAWSAEL